MSKCVRTSKDFEKIKEAADVLFEDLDYEGKTFKVFTNRVDKSFTLTSPEISRELGAYILKNFKNLSVDIKKPELEIHLDLKITLIYLLIELRDLEDFRSVLLVGDLYFYLVGLIAQLQDF